VEDKRKHILFLPEWYPHPHDVQLAIFVEKFARAAALNYKVSLIFCGPFAEGKDVRLIHKKEGGFNTYLCFYPKQKRKLKAYNYFMRAHERCWKKMVEEEGVPNMVHLHMLFRNYIAYTKIYRKYIPQYMLTEQWSGYLHGSYESLGFYRKTFYKKAFANAYFVTAVSNRLSAALKKYFTIQNPIIILPNIAEVAPKIKPVAENEFRILVVADLVDQVKNITGVIEALKNANIAKKIHFTLVGDGDDRDLIHKKAAELDTEKCTVNLMGRLENPAVLEVMQQNHILITNSRHETFSMVTAEALLAGMPVICTRCGGPEEFVDETNGILIDVDDTKALTGAIEKMSLSYASYSPQQLSYPVLQKFGIQAIAAQLQNIYERILIP
jgi:glycosyltransferase involved in cell wall biosynthesis